MRGWSTALLTLPGLFLAGTALCQTGLARIPPDRIDDTVRLGRVMVIAPLCGLRDGAWAADLRRGALQQATQSPATDDAGLKAAPNAGLAEGALGYAESEALEDFAAAPPDATCLKLPDSAELAEADRVVEDWRRRASGS
jgi:hypothetical protein